MANKPLYKCPRCGSFSSIDYFIESHACETTGRKPPQAAIEQAKAIKLKDEAAR